MKSVQAAAVPRVLLRLQIRSAIQAVHGAHGKAGFSSPVCREAGEGGGREQPLPALEQSGGPGDPEQRD